MCSCFLQIFLGVATAAEAGNFILCIFFKEENFLIYSFIIASTCDLFIAIWPTCYVLAAVESQYPSCLTWRVGGAPCIFSHDSYFSSPKTNGIHYSVSLTYCSVRMGKMKLILVNLHRAAIEWRETIQVTVSDTVRPLPPSFSIFYSHWDAWLKVMCEFNFAYEICIISSAGCSDAQLLSFWLWWLRPKKWRQIPAGQTLGGPYSFDFIWLSAENPVTTRATGHFPGGSSLLSQDWLECRCTFPWGHHPETEFDWLRGDEEKHNCASLFTLCFDFG